MHHKGAPPVFLSVSLAVYPETHAGSHVCGWIVHGHPATAQNTYTCVHIENGAHRGPHIHTPIESREGYDFKGENETGGEEHVGSIPAWVASYNKGARRLKADFWEH